MPPLVIGPPALFRELRAFLTDSYYSEAAVCARLGLQSPQDYLTLRPNPASPCSIQDRLDVAARLFIIGEMVKNDELKKWVPVPVLEAMRGLGLIVRHSRQPEPRYATAACIPRAGCTWCPTGGPARNARLSKWPRTSSILQ